MAKFRLTHSRRLPRRLLSDSDPSWSCSSASRVAFTSSQSQVVRPAGSSFLALVTQVTLEVLCGIHCVELLQQGTASIIREIAFRFPCVVRFIVAFPLNIVFKLFLLPTACRRSSIRSTSCTPAPVVTDLAGISCLPSDPRLSCENQGCVDSMNSSRVRVLPAALG